MNNLPKVVTWQCRSAESNLRPVRPQDYKFGTLLLDYQGYRKGRKKEIITAIWAEWLEKTVTF